MPKNTNTVLKPSQNYDIWQFQCPCGHEINVGGDKRRFDMLQKLHYKRCEKARTHAVQGTTNSKIYGSPNCAYAIAHT